MQSNISFLPQELKNPNPRLGVLFDPIVSHLEKIFLSLDGHGVGRAWEAESCDKSGERGG